MTRPLLVIDGDSFAHRSYHALPKTIRRRGNKGGGAIVGFANFLLRLYETERPSAMLVAWDTLDEPTYRHRALADYRSGREFDTELVDQLDILPEFVAACGFANAKAAGYEADDSWRRPWQRRNDAAQFLLPPAIGMPISWPPPRHLVEPSLQR
jgi:DNA polymerase I